MIRSVQRYLSSIPPVFIDGVLYGLIAVFTFCQAYFGGDEAAKYMPAEAKFWLNGTLGILASFCAAIKMFRSTSYSEHRKEVETEKKIDPTIPKTS